MIQGGDGIRVVHPLFQEEGGGSIPTSPLQLEFSKVNSKLAANLVELWHSRLPLITNWQACSRCYAAQYGGRWFAAAMWGAPIAPKYNGMNYVELRRFAIADDAPRNLASRFLSWMIKQIRNEGYTKAISYQDTEVHRGTIYKASGWRVGGETGPIGISGWTNKRGNKMQSRANKIRWELDL